jgi:hypothetical protein
VTASLRSSPKIDVHGGRIRSGSADDAECRAGINRRGKSYIGDVGRSPGECAGHHLAPFSNVLSKGDVLRRQANSRQIFLTARGPANVALWRTYLPEDCVTAMIKDRWHLEV